MATGEMVGVQTGFIAHATNHPIVPPFAAGDFEGVPEPTGLPDVFETVVHRGRQRAVRFEDAPVGGGAGVVTSGAQLVPGEPEPTLDPVRSVNVFEETVGSILRLVKLGSLLPGERLPSERELARQLQVSRPTVREALHSLAGTGYLTTLRGRHGGTYVLDWSPAPSGDSVRAVARAMGAQLADALDFRLVVEPGAAALAAQRIEAADMPRLDAAFALVAEAPRITFPARARDAIDGAAGRGARSGTPDPSAPLSYRVADRRLHLVIAELARSASVAAAVTEAQVRLSELLAATPQMEEVISHSEQQHAEIVAAIKRGDAAAAARAMHDHISGTASYLRGFLQ